MSTRPENAPAIQPHARIPALRYKLFLHLSFCFAYDSYRKYLLVHSGRSAQNRRACHPIRSGKRPSQLSPSYNSLSRLWTNIVNEMSENKTANAETERKLRALVAEYERKMEDVANLVTRVRHEINNPLTGVLGQAQLLLREDLNEKARKRAQTIEQLAIRLTEVAAELRQVQKPMRRSEGD